MLNIGDIVYHKSELFGHDNYVKGCVKDTGRFDIIQVKFENVKRNYWWMKESEVELPMKSLEEFFAHPTCLNSLDKVKAYVQDYAGETAPIYRVQNLGKQSFLCEETWFRKDNMRFHRFVIQTKDSKNPEFVGDVDDFSAPELSHLTFVNYKDVGNFNNYLVGDTLESVSYKPGDLNGAFNLNPSHDNEPLVSFAGYVKPYEGRDPYVEMISTTYFTDFVNSYGFSHRVFTDKVIAEQYLEFCMNDPASIKRGLQHQADCDLLDSLLDDYFDDRDFDFDFDEDDL